MILNGKKILIGVTGSIAAYKAALLVRLLVKQGAVVKVLMTDSARDFITPLTLATLSKNPVLSSFVSSDDGTWTNHVELGLWADALVIAPASANTLAKCASGICDNLLTAVYLSARCPVFFAPAMDLDMYGHPATRHNLQTLKLYGNTIIEAETGELASGLEGQGRLAEPEHIVAVLEGALNTDKRFSGKRVMITAGPTREDIDPVRFISNHSSGKMGYELAAAFHESGAEVTVISGPVSISAPAGVKIISVRSAREMLDAAREVYPLSDISIFAAAVADYAPAEKAGRKIKKNDGEMSITLVKNPDIAVEMGKLKTPAQLNIGFALETDNEMEYALKKLESKNFDLIVLNSLQDKGAGFRYDTNKITIADRKGRVVSYDLKSKASVARDIRAYIIEILNEKTGDKSE